MMMTLRWERLDDDRDLVGESPLWCPRDDCIYWIDARRCLVRALRLWDGHQRRWQLPERVGSIARGPGNSIMVAMGAAFHCLQLDSGELKPVGTINSLADGLFLNDGKADRTGRFLSGTLYGREDAIGKGGLFSLAADLAISQVERQIDIANALCFSPDGRRMYFADTMSGIIRVYDYDPATGIPTRPNPFADTKALFGSVPDGATVDTEGRVWVSLVQAAAIACFASDGTVVRVIDAPMIYPSALAFGGPDMDLLFLTSISDPGAHVPPSDHAESGLLHVLHGSGAHGITETSFGG